MRNGLPLVVAGVLLLAGCQGQIFDCPDPRDYFDLLTRTCVPRPEQEDPGQCLPAPPFGFDNRLALLWVGENGTAPACPEGTQYSDRLEHADLIADHTCEPCACKPPTGSCVVPTQITAHNATCAGMGPIATSFDAPAPWSGACDNSNPIPPGALCNSSPCVQSVTVEPPQVVENGCGVVVPPVPKKWLTPTWKSEVRACMVEPQPPNGECPGEVRVTGPVAPPPPGFRVCIRYVESGDWSDDCPMAYSEPVIAYTDRLEDLQDNRSCEPCSCNIVQPSACSTDLVLYKSPDCTQPAELFLDVKSGALSPCHDVPAGVGLMSKAALNTQYTPGVCEPQGGKPIGEVVLERPATYCCKPLKDSAP